MRFIQNDEEKVMKQNTHRRRIRKGRDALKVRRKGALDRLEKVETPNKRELAEIEVLRQRVSRG
jgi:hypothetical protein